MSLRINYNSAASNAYSSLSKTDSSLSKSIQRLSSGYKINSAADDPSGLVISEKLRAQSSGLSTAISNAGDASNMVQTAEGALTEVNSLLRSMRDLAVQAANTGASDDASLQALQQQINSAIESINKISSETQFGEKKLLDGSAGLTSTITGTSVTAVDISNANNITSDLSGVDIVVTQAATKAQLTGTVDLTAGSLSGDTITINGVQIQGGATESETLDNINAQSSETGVTATADASHHLVLSQSGYGSTNKVEVTGGTNIFGAASASAAGNDVEATVKDSDGNNVTSGSWNYGTGTILTDQYGNSIALTTAAATATGTLSDQFDIDAGTLTFQVGAYAGQTRSLNISSIAANKLGVANGTTTTASIADIDVVNNATDAITVLDKAISDVSSQRATLGAIQTNVLDSATNSLTVAQENISSSESTIRDTDMASTMVEFTKQQVQEQAGVAMLAQANQIPQYLLKLIG